MDIHSWCTIAFYTLFILEIGIFDRNLQAIKKVRIMQSLRTIILTFSTIINNKITKNFISKSMQGILHKIES